MINIQKFVKIRKQQGLSQTELCQGICTQATLSKFENLGRIPSMRIITQLCARMNISLADLMEDVDTSSQKIAELFAKADFDLITYNYNEIATLLAKFNVTKLSKDDAWHFNYLKGSIAMYRDNNLIDGLFYFNSILTDTDVNKDSIYYLLALSGCGQIYELQEDIKKAEHYFDLVFDKIMQRPITNDQMAIKVLNILYQGSVFYSKKNDFNTSNSLLKYAYQICSDNHHVFYLARIMYQLAKNAIHTNESKETIEQYIYDARAFARLNNNTHLLNKISALTY